MGQDLFKYLPSEIIINILSRLTVVTIAISKCVYKSWLDLLETDYFVKFHLSTSAAALAVLTREENSSWCTVFELKDEIVVESSHDHHFNHLTTFNFPRRVAVEGSANGILFLHKYGHDFEALYVCNPISREYIELHCPQGFFIPPRDIYGFGASKISGQHKVVCIKRDYDCHVYTLGTGSWRCLEAARASFSYGYCNSGAFVNGNIHWLVRDSSNYTPLISCFDLETECFSTFSVSTVLGDKFIGKASVLKDCLCLCDYTSRDENVIIIWLMKEYGVEKSWTKEYAININPDFDSIGFGLVSPIKVFQNGDILMIWDHVHIFYYSNRTKTSREIGVFDIENSYLNLVLLTPSFLPLKSFKMENVISL